MKLKREDSFSKIGFWKTNEICDWPSSFLASYMKYSFLCVSIPPPTHKRGPFFHVFYRPTRAMCRVERCNISILRISPTNFVNSSSSYFTPPLADVLFNYLGFLFFENVVNFVFQYDRKINCIGRAHCTLYLRHCSRCSSLLIRMPILSIGDLSPYRFLFLFPTLFLSSSIWESSINVVRNFVRRRRGRRRKKKGKKNEYQRNDILTIFNFSMREAQSSRRDYFFRGRLFRWSESEDKLAEKD